MAGHVSIYLCTNIKDTHQFSQLTMNDHETVFYIIIIIIIIIIIADLYSAISGNFRGPGHIYAVAVLGTNIWGPGPSLFGRQQQLSEITN